MQSILKIQAMSKTVEKKRWKDKVEIKQIYTLWNLLNTKLVNLIFNVINKLSLKLLCKYFIYWLPKKEFLLDVYEKAHMV